MAEYIKREAVVKAVEKYGLTNGVVWGRHTGLAICIASEIADIPAADVAPVTRCKDCRNHRELNRKDRLESGYAEGVLWCMNRSDGVWADGFCSDGEPKED